MSYGSHFFALAYDWRYNTVTQLSRYQVVVTLPEVLVQITPVTMDEQSDGGVACRQRLPVLLWVYLARVRFVLPIENKVDNNNTASVIASRRCLHRNFFIMINFCFMLTLLHGFSASPIIAIDCAII